MSSITPIIISIYQEIIFFLKMYNWIGCKKKIVRYNSPNHDLAMQPLFPHQCTITSFHNSIFVQLFITCIYFLCILCSELCYIKIKITKKPYHFSFSSALEQQKVILNLLTHHLNLQLQLKIIYCCKPETNVNGIRDLQAELFLLSRREIMLSFVNQRFPRMAQNFGSKIIFNSPTPLT